MIDRATDRWLEQAADRFGTPCFVYLTDPIKTRMQRIRESFGGRFRLSYAVKSNPNPALLAWMNGRCDDLDVSSIGELDLAVRAGWDAARASFTGPAKRAFEIDRAIRLGVGELVVESVGEARTADAIARSLGRVQDILVRIAPAVVPRGFGDQMAGRPCAFGIDIEDSEAQLAEIIALGGLRVTGFHIYSGTQCLKADAVVENYRIFLDIFAALCRRHALSPDKLVFGSGLGIPYHDGDTAIDLDAVAATIVPDLDTLRADPRFAKTALVLELGRYLVGEAGYFVTRVVSIKQSRGTIIAICDGGMNNHLPAAGHFGMVMRRNYPMHRVGGGEPAEKVDLVGPLCTSIDRLASGVLLPRLAQGDLIAVHNSGAYGLTASPVHFISHPMPQEAMVVAGELMCITRSANAFHPAAASPAERQAMPRYGFGG